MATIRLGRYEAVDGDLPRLCMRCGAPATTFGSKRFAWHPPWVFVLILAGLLPFAIVALVLTKRLRLRAPLCDGHRNHWFMRSLIVWLSFVALLGLGVVAFTVFAGQEGRPGRNDALVGLLCLGTVAGLIAWLILVAVLQQTAIHPTEITERDITLAGVSPRFADAVLDGRRYARDEDDEYEDEYDEPRPHRRRPPPLPPDAFEEH